VGVDEEISDAESMVGDSLTVIGANVMEDI